jgi:pSer/pThr/pTyr-binding forkhead associated (FHA) protein
LIDQSANGTFLNGQRVQETFLKDGDVLVFADGGPKVSFLTQIMKAQPEAVSSTSMEPPAKPVSPTPAAVEPPERQIPVPPVRPAAQKPNLPLGISAPASNQPAVAAAQEPPIVTQKAPLIIQFGPTLRSFDELPVSIGKNPSCDFSVNHPAVLDRHAQIYYSQGQYWVKDLTGQNQILINGQPIAIQAPLNPECRLSLSSRGPSFRFLGAGRLAEIEEPTPEPPPPRPSQPEPTTPRDISAKKPLKGPADKLKKFFKR